MAFADDAFEADPRIGAIYVARANGSDLRRLTGYRSLNTHPDWSPDGSTIAFTSTLDSPGPGDAGSTIDVVGADGTGLTSLTDGSRFDMMPSWSPDGSRILFRGDDQRGANADIDLYGIQADGTGLVSVTPDETLDLEGNWSPDGELIVFATADDLIFVASNDGTSVAEVTDGHAVDWQPIVVG